MRDKLNNLESKYPRIDYEVWFSLLDIPKEDIEKRIEMAEKLESVYFWLFNLITVSVLANEYIDTDSLIASVQYRLSDIADLDARYVSDHIVRFADETVRATVDNADDPFFLSDERATTLAADEAHTLCSYEELQEAYDNGMTRKTWNTQHDRRVRKSHVAADGQTVPIDKMFIVNGYEMATVKDSENGAPLSEISNCRCWVTFS